MRIAKIDKVKMAACEPSARKMANRVNGGLTISTKNKIKQMSVAVSDNSPKNSPFEAPMQSTRPDLARCAMATARRDNITSSRCSRSSSLLLA